MPFEDCDEMAKDKGKFLVHAVLNNGDGVSFCNLKILGESESDWVELFITDVLVSKQSFVTLIDLWMDADSQRHQRDFDKICPLAFE